MGDTCYPTVSICCVIDSWEGVGRGLCCGHCRRVNQGIAIFHTGFKAMNPQKNQAQPQLVISPSQALTWQARVSISFSCLEPGPTIQGRLEGWPRWVLSFSLSLLPWASWSLQESEPELTGRASGRQSVSEADGQVGGLGPCLFPKPSRHVCHHLKPGGWP